VLGLKITGETYRKERDSWKLDLRVNDDTQIELFSFPNPPARPGYPEATGLRHLAFAVKSLDEWINHLQKNNIITEPVRIDEFTGKRFTFFADPDQLPIELYEL
jgi:glyoxylase I family protein